MEYCEDSIYCLYLERPWGPHQSLNLTQYVQYKTMQRQKPFVNIPFIFVCPWKEDDMMYTHNFVMVDMICCAKWKLYLHYLSQNLKDGFCIHKRILMAFLYVNFTYLPSVLYWYLRRGSFLHFMHWTIHFNFW